MAPSELVVWQCRLPRYQLPGSANGLARTGMDETAVCSTPQAVGSANRLPTAYGELESPAMTIGRLPERQPDAVFPFRVPQTQIFGSGAVEKIGDECQRLGLHRALV